MIDTGGGRVTDNSNAPRGRGLLAIGCVEGVVAAATLIADFAVIHGDGWESMSRFIVAFSLVIVLVTTSFICLVFGLVERALSRRKAGASLGMLNGACILHAVVMVSSVAFIALWSI